jgi:hypothetical protein
VVGCGLLSEVSIFVTNPPSLILLFCVVFEDDDVAVLGILLRYWFDPILPAACSVEGWTLAR